MKQSRESPPVIEYKYETKEQEMTPCGLLESAVIGLKYRASNFI